MALSYLEDLDSQIPAIQLLRGLKSQGSGWEYLPPEEALQLRNSRKDQVVLTGILRPWLENNNNIHTKGETHPFTDTNTKTKEALHTQDSICSTDTLIFTAINAILSLTHPPRLSGFDRDAQPWWVFYACLLWPRILQPCFLRPVV